jgi:hypothetical protein
VRFRLHFRVAQFALAGLVLLVTALPAFAQNCSLCYTQAASAGARMIQALRSGILILIIPPTIGTAFVLYVAHRRRNQFAAPHGLSKADRW